MSNNQNKIFYTWVSASGNKINFAGYDENKKKFFKSIPYTPHLFIPLKNSEENESCNMTGFITNVPLKKKTFPSIRDFKDYVKFITEESFYSDHPNLYGTKNLVNQVISTLFTDEISVDYSLIDIGIIDIETDSCGGFANVELADKAILSIAYYSTKKKKYFVWGLKSFSPHKENLEYKQFSTEDEMLRDFVAWWSARKHANAPDVLTGWYSLFYDLPYLKRRLTNLFGEEIAKKLSPFKWIYETKNKDEEKSIVISGIDHLDYMELYKKFGKNQFGEPENYRLDTIAEMILEEKKLDYSEYPNLDQLYQNDHQKFIEYNVKDVELIVKMEEKIKLMSFAMFLAYKAKVTYRIVLGTTQIWEMLIYDTLLKENKVPHIPGEVFGGGGSYVGAYVKSPLLGMREWIVSFDINSMYPNIMIEKNISPETLLRNVRAGNLNAPNQLISVIDDNSWKVDAPPNSSVAANGVCFSNEQRGILPKLLKGMYEERVTIKDEMIRHEIELQKTLNERDRINLQTTIQQLKNRQLAIKIFLNSVYGALGNAYFLFHSTESAAAVTTTGQMIIFVIEKIINEIINKELRNKEAKDYVLAIDTDGVYIDFDWVVDWIKRNEKISNPSDDQIISTIDKLSERVFIPVFDKTFKKISEKTNSYEPRTAIKREVIAKRGFWTNKKRYVLNMVDKEGVRYTTPKKKIMGIEAIKSSTPKICKDAIKTSLDIILNKTELDLCDFVEEFRTNFILSAPEDIGSPRGVSEINKWYATDDHFYKKGTPIHVRASMLYNKIVSEQRLTQYELIREGEKIKFLYLITPNPINQNVFGFPHKFPVETGLSPWIDYETQFEKTFLNPLNLILEKVGWSIKERVITLDDAFMR